MEEGACKGRVRQNRKETVRPQRKPTEKLTPIQTRKYPIRPRANGPTVSPSAYISLWLCLSFPSSKHAQTNFMSTFHCFVSMKLVILTVTIYTSFSQTLFASELKAFGGDVKESQAVWFLFFFVKGNVRHALLFARCFAVMQESQMHSQRCCK